MCSFWWKLLLPPQSVSHFFTTFYFPLLLLFSLSGTSSTVCLLPAFLLECGIWSFFFYHHYSANENLLFVLAAFLSVCLAAIPDSMSQCVLSFPLALFFLSFPFFFFCLAQFYCGAVFFLFFFFATGFYSTAAAAAIYCAQCNECADPVHTRTTLSPVTSFCLLSVSSSFRSFFFPHSFPAAAAASSSTVDRIQSNGCTQISVQLDELEQEKEMERERRSNEQCRAMPFSCHSSALSASALLDDARSNQLSDGSLMMMAHQS